MQAHLVAMMRWLPSIARKAARHRSLQMGAS